MIFWMIQMLETEEKRDLAEQIFLENEKRMYTIANNILRNHHDAEEAVMDAMVRIMNHIQNFLPLPPEERTALLIVYTRNVAKDIYRRNQKKQALSLTIFEDESFENSKQLDLPDESEDVTAMVLRKEQMEEVKKAFEQLSEEQRDVLYLNIFYEYDFRTIGTVLGIRDDAARARLCRARRKLEKLLGETYGSK